jgi:hypothetical protein
MYRAIRFTAPVIVGMALAACSGAPAPDETGSGAPAPAEPAESARASAPVVEAESAAIDLTDYVRIPGGMLTHRSCTHQIPDGHSVDEDRIVRDGAGNVVRQLPACAHPPVRSRRTPHPQQGEGGQAHGTMVPDTGGWLSWVNQQVPSSATTWTYILSTWTVPPAPHDTSALEYYFNGVETSNGDTILQPVLQWGNNGLFGGEYWVVANWEAFSDGTANVSDYMLVSTGDTLFGTVRTGNPNQWSVQIVDVTAQQSVTGTFSNSRHFPKAQSAVHESYGDNACNDAVEFYALRLYANEHGGITEVSVPYNPSPEWVTSGPPYCFYQPTISGTTTWIQ